MLSIIIFILSIVLDGIISIYIKPTSYLQPLFTITSVFMLYTRFKNKKTLYLITISITGLIYDLLYTNLLFFHAVLFILIGNLTIYIYKNFKQNILTTIFFLILLIATYESIIQLILFIFRIIPFSTKKITYKIIHSLILNIIFAVIIFSLHKGIKSKKKHNLL